MCFSSEVDESSKLPIRSQWDNLANNPGGKLAWFTFFFFGVVSFEKDCAIVTGKSANANANNDTNNNNSGNNNANDNNDTTIKKKDLGQGREMRTRDKDEDNER